MRKLHPGLRGGKNKHVHSRTLRMSCFISLLYFFFWVVDGPLQTDVKLMRLNINGSEPSNHGAQAKAGQDAHCHFPQLAPQTYL